VRLLQYPDLDFLKIPQAVNYLFSIASFVAPSVAINTIGERKMMGEQ